MPLRARLRGKADSFFVVQLSCRRKGTEKILCMHTFSSDSSDDDISSIVRRWAKEHDILEEDVMGFVNFIIGIRDSFSNEMRAVS